VIGKLSEYLSEKTIKLNVDCKDWEDAVRSAGQLLFEAGAVESSYLDGMVKYIKRYGPYVVLLPGFALAHARPEDGAKRVAMSLITLKNPVCFGHENNDPVYVVMGLSATANEKHVQALADICDMLKDPNILNKIREAVTIEEIKEILSENYCEEVK
jgi:PTS system ascorbate-specific IIA component